MNRFELDYDSLQFWRSFVLNKILPRERERLGPLATSLNEINQQMQSPEISSNPKRHRELERELEKTSREIAFIQGNNLDAFDLEALTDSQFERYFELRNHYKDTGNSFWLLETFVWFISQRIAPPSWVLVSLGRRFQKHLKDPDIEKLANQLGVQARGSGSTSPYDAYLRQKGNEPALYDMMILTACFEVSKTDAARATVAKHNLSISPKRLCNLFNEQDAFFDPTDSFVAALREGVRQVQQRYTKTFPPNYRKLFRKRRP